MLKGIKYFLHLTSTEELKGILKIIYH